MHWATRSESCQIYTPSNGSSGRDPIRESRRITPAHWAKRHDSNRVTQNCSTSNGSGGRDSIRVMPNSSPRMGKLLTEARLPATCRMSKFRDSFQTRTRRSFLAACCTNAQPKACGRQLVRAMGRSQKPSVQHQRAIAFRLGPCACFGQPESLPLRRLAFRWRHGLAQVSRRGSHRQVLAAQVWAFFWCSACQPRKRLWFRPLLHS